MGRNLYILAGTLGFFALAALGLSFSNIAEQPGSSGDRTMWQTMAIAFLIASLLMALAGVLSSLFEQAERRAEQARRDRRRRR